MLTLGAPDPSFPPFLNDYLGESCSNDGNDSGVTYDLSGIFAPVCSACIIIVNPLPALGGITTVAASDPLRTHVCPVLGTPSQPVYGSRIHLSLSVGFPIDENAFLAPMAIASFCAPTAPICVFCEVFSRSHDSTHRCALSSVHCPRSDVTGTLGGSVICIPAVRSLAAEFSDGP